MHLPITLFQRMPLFYLTCAWVLMGRLRGTGQGRRGGSEWSRKGLVLYFRLCSVVQQEQPLGTFFIQHFFLSVKQVHSVIIWTPVDSDAMIFTFLIFTLLTGTGHRRRNQMVLGQATEEQWLGRCSWTPCFCKLPKTQSSENEKEKPLRQKPSHPQGPFSEAYCLSQELRLL